MKKDQYKIEKYKEKLERGEYTGFIPRSTATTLQHQLRKNSFSEFIPFEDADKIIFYTKTKPEITLCKIICSKKITHAMILGTLFSLSLCDDTFGDIIFWQENFYIYLFSNLYPYLKQELSTIGQYKVQIETVPLNSLADYKREFLEKKVIVSSLRIDNIISQLIETSRDKILEKMKNQEIILNDEILKKPHINLKENDRFSIRKQGKFLFDRIEGKTKKDKFILIIKKYC